MKISLAQINPTIADLKGNKAKIISFIEKALKQKADLIIFPELALLGYPPMDLLKKIFLIKENLKILEELKKYSNQIAIICGFADFDYQHPPLLFNSAAFISQGEIKLKQAKTLLPSYDVFDEQRYFSSASTSEVITFLGKKIGLTICEDLWNSSSQKETKNFMEQRKYHLDPLKNLISQGAEIIINLAASPYTKGKIKAKEKMLKNLARINKVPIIYVNQVGGNDSLIFDGHSFAINKQGVIIAQGKGFAEDLISFKINSSPKKNLKSSINEIENIRKALVLGIKDYVQKCGFKQVLLGLSGGIDSALTAALAVEALGAKNVLSVTMPSSYSSLGSVKDSAKLAANLKIKMETIAISSLFDLLKKELAPLFLSKQEDITEENLQARIRGILLMALSNKLGKLLLTTGNKSELAVGYCTLYGDMSGGLAVISDLPKTLVYKIARHINKNRQIIPPQIIKKEPSAELKPNQKDQDSLPPYNILDQILELYIEQEKSKSEIIALGFDSQIVKDICQKINLNEYKRLQAAPGLKVTSKAFGLGRRIPIAHKFKN